MDITVSDKIDFKPRLVRENRKGQYIFIEGKIHQNNMGIFNIYAPNTRTPMLTIEPLLHHIIAHWLSYTDSGRLQYITLAKRWVIQTKRKYKNVPGNWSHKPKRLTDVYRTFHPNPKEYTFFLASNRTFSNIDYLLWHKASLNSHKKIEIHPI